MPKSKKQLKSRQVVSTPLGPAPSLASTSPSPAAGGGDELDASNPNMSRGQRKRLARRSQHSSRMSLVNSSLSLTNHRAKSSASAGGRQNASLMGAVGAALPAYDPAKQKPAEAPPVLVETVRAKKSTALKEVTHLKLVQEHPEFQLDPFAAIQAHLNNTLAAPVEHSGDSRHGKKKEVGVVGGGEEKVKRNGSAKRKNKGRR